MGVDVTIKNKQLFKKPLTVSDLTLGKYQCGVPDQYGRSSRKPGAGDLVIYDENRIGRGVVAFSWSGSVRNQIDLRLNSLSTYTDIDMFCEIVKNILCVWKAKKFEWDGVEYTEADLGNLIAEQKNFTLDLLADIDNVGKGRNDYITIPCALINLDLDIGMLKACGTSKDEKSYADLLHKLQSPDLYYAVPSIFEHKERKKEFFGNYVITTNTGTIFPVKASVPLMFTNPNTGKALECTDFRVSLFDYDKKQMIGTLDFDDFIRKADISNCPEFDASHVVLKGMSAEELQGLLD